MKIVKTKIKDLFLVKTNIYKDNRGYFKEVEKILKDEESFKNLNIREVRNRFILISQ